MALVIGDVIKQSRENEPFSRTRLIEMLSLDPASPESYQLMAEAKRVAREVSADKAEVHGQFALNLAPCPKNCLYCSFAAANGVFDKAMKLSPRQAVDSALALEQAGVNAVYMMTTANYPFEELLDMICEVRRSLRPETVLVGNIADQTASSAVRLRRAGLQGVYHALRLREGIDTGLDPEARKASMRAFQEAGLVIGTCVEPVGPEHGNDEIAELILYTGSLNPGYSGAARRIPIPGTAMAARGTISELRMAQVVAVTRLGLPRSVKGACTHEPCSLGAAAGANLLWAEIGANPRDVKEKTEEGRGFTPKRCREIFSDAECGVLEGPSVFYGGAS